MKKKDIDFLKDVFLADESGEKTHIVKVDGAESGHDHLRIYTQSADQKENGVVTLFKIYQEEVDAAEHCVTNVPPSDLGNAVDTTNTASE